MSKNLLEDIPVRRCKCCVMPEVKGELEFDENGICVRAGYHCCPLGHKVLNTPQGGAVRASVSVYNSKYDIDQLLSVLNKK